MSLLVNQTCDHTGPSHALPVLPYRLPMHTCIIIVLSYPSLQSQIKLPGVFRHVPSPHTPCMMLHSSISGTSNYDRVLMMDGITDFLNTVHILSIVNEYNIGQTNSVSILRWKDGEAPTKLNLLDRIHLNPLICDHIKCMKLTIPNGHKWVGASLHHHLRTETDPGP
jgi:hypothetical protein